MTRHIKLLILLKWKEEGQWDIYRDIRDRVGRAAVLQPFLPRGPGAGLVRRASLALAEFYLPVAALAGRTRFNAVLSWTLRMGICYGLLNRLLPSRSRARHVINDFHINLVRRDWRHRLKLQCLKLALPGIDYFFCTSTQEEGIYARMFGIAPERIRFLPLSPPAHLCRLRQFSKRDYIFAYGNSDRDFDTLIEAVQNTGIEVIILSQTYLPRHRLPDHIRIIADRKPAQELWELIGAARLVVVPLGEFNISAGQIAMLEVMALGRPLVITANMATGEYATHGETALFYAAGDAAELRSHVLFLWQHVEAAETMGRRARQTARLYPGKDSRVLLEALEKLVPQRAGG